MAKNNEVQDDNKEVTINQATLNALMQGAHLKKKGGIGKVWNESTFAIGETFGTLGHLASAGRSLAENAEKTTFLSTIETSKELLSSLGLEAEGVEALQMSDALMQYLRSRR